MPEQPLVSVAVTVKLLVPICAGAPFSTPRDDRLKPDGNVPAVTAKAQGPKPPLAVRVWL